MNSCHVQYYITPCNFLKNRCNNTHKISSLNQLICLMGVQRFDNISLNMLLYVLSNHINTFNNHVNAKNISNFV